jgi:hypothetical protein
VPTSRWRPIAEQIDSLPIDESVDFVEYPTDKMAVSKFRCGVSAILPCLKFLVRTLPTGGLRAIKIGSWGSYSWGTEEFVSATPHPVLMVRQPGPNSQMLAPHSNLYLGRLAFSSMHTSDVPKNPRCVVKGCPFPAAPGVGNCNYHIRSYSMPFSLLGDTLDHDLIWGSDKHPEPILYVGLAFQIQRGDCFFEYKGSRKYDDLWNGRGWGETERWRTGIGQKKNANVRKNQRSNHWMFNKSRHGF